MKDISSKWTTLTFSILVLIFIALNISKVFLPYIWDELACYTNTAIHLSVHGVSLLPSAAPPDLSFGHPLFLQSVVALFIKIFGNSKEVVHLVVLSFTISLIVVFFLFLKNRFSNVLSLLGVSFLMFQALFSAQSVLFQLEMGLALLVFSAFILVLKHHFLAYFIFCSSALLTKESALVFPIAVFVSFVFEQLIARKISLKHCFFALSPILVFLGFIFIQKQTHGFYLSPINLNVISFDWSVFKERWTYNINFIFFDQGRQFWFYLMILVLIFNLTQLNKTKLIAFLNQKEIILALVFTFGFLVFSSLNNPLERYSLVLFPFLAFFSVFIVNSSKINLNLKYLILLASLIPSFFYQSSKHRFTESDNSYLYHIESMQKMTDFMISNQLHKKTVYAAWPMVNSIVHPHNGMISESFSEVKMLNINEIDSINACYLFTFPGNISDTVFVANFKKIKTFEKHYAKCVLYQTND